MNSREKGKRLKEVWAAIPEYEGLYEASSLGRVRSLPRKTTSGRILKQQVNRANGYCYVSLSKENRQVTARVHKLVWEAFTHEVVHGYDKFRTLNHIDGDKTNNAFDNLEMITQTENQIHAIEMGLQRKRGLQVINLDTMETYSTATDAAISVGGKLGEMVSRVCRGERSHYRGIRFAFLDDYINGNVPEFKGRKRKASVSLWR